MRGSLKEDAFLALVMMIWGFNPVLIKLGLRDIDPFALIMLRNVAMLALLVVLFFAVERRWPRWPSGYLARILAIAIIGVTLTQVMFNLSLKYTSVANNALIGATPPIFGLIFARIFEGERSSLRRWLGVLLGLAGIAVMVWGGQGQFSFGAESFLGDLLVLGATITMTLQAMMGKPLLKSMSAMELTLISILIGVPFMLPLTWEGSVGQVWSAVLPLAWGAAIASAIIIAVVLVVMYRVVAASGASKFLLFMYLTPVSGVLAGMVILQEPLTLMQVIGAVAVLVGVNEARKEPKAAAGPVKLSACAEA